MKSCAKALKHKGRIAILIGDNAGIDALESIKAAVALVEDLNVIASASISEDAPRRPWAKSKRNYRREHCILIEKK